MAGKFRLEFVDCPGEEPLEFEDKAELDAMVDLIKSCPVDDNPPGVGKFARLRITEYGVVGIKIV